MSSDSRASRRPTTSRTPSGMPSCSTGSRVVQPSPSPFDGPGLGQVAEHLPDEERISLRLLVDGPGQGEAGLVERLARSLLDDGRHAHVVEAAQGQPLHTALAAKVGHDFDQGMVVGQLGVPVGAQDEDPPAAGAARRGAGAAASASPPTGGRRARAAGAPRRRRRSARRPRRRRGGSAPSPDRTGAGPAGPEPARSARAPDGPAPRRSDPDARPAGRGRRSGAAPPRTAGTARPRSSSQRPASTVAPSSCTVRASSAARRVLPTPGSPARRATRSSPAAASFHSCPSRSSSPSRPTKMRPMSVRKVGSGTADLRERLPVDLDGRDAARAAPSARGCRPG